MRARPTFTHQLLVVYFLSSFSIPCSVSLYFFACFLWVSMCFRLFALSFPWHKFGISNITVCWRTRGREGGSCHWRCRKIVWFHAFSASTLFWCRSQVGRCGSTNHKKKVFLSSSMTSCNAEENDIKRWKSLFVT